MDLSIAIVSWNTQGLLDQCIQSIYANTYEIDYEVIVVDNASSDGSSQMVREKYPWVRLIASDENLGFVGGNNKAYKISDSRLFLLLNPDTVCFDGALTKLARFLDIHPKIGAAGPLVMNPDDTLQPSWARFPKFITEASGKLDRRIAASAFIPSTPSEIKSIGPFQTDWVGGCCLMIKRDAVREIGLMDDRLFMFCEETDWCFRLHKAGWEIWVEPSAEIVHFGGQSTKQASAEMAKRLRLSKAAYFSKHHGSVQGFALSVVLNIKSALKSALRGGVSKSPS